MSEAADKPQQQVDAQRVFSALMGLHRAYPLERRILKEACDSTRETYLAVLLRWVQTASAPSVDGLDREALEELVALDALLPAEDGLGCPPFSASATDLRVHFPHAALHALSALDALAMPRILGASATIEARCAMSGVPLQIRMTEAGEVMAQDMDAARVAFRKVSDSVNHYAFDLAPGIRFVLPEAGSALMQTLSLGEAVAVAHAFYNFQRKLMRDD